MDDQELDKLEEKTKWSGFNREKSGVIILNLIKELRTHKIMVKTMTETIANMEKYMQDYRNKTHTDPGIH